ncbi:hypothetical protein G7074_18105 [Pedobacter sp. HDW13]|uniref:hypothetical protein n=1 Tax=Pedobacter sp. HDW13 TaxID=2714940 RepID=UPI00140A1865|nr:hypothetical protein [Pedobacter sp. HDW13]QIL41009.1 hypothetical protein G7074_18105 [Pedobacter sp. HDW13]
MLEFINNPWTIGIVGSVISGIIVYIVTERIFKRKINKEISENIRLANAEIMYAIRPLIAANVTPDQDTVTSLFNATARKHDVSIGSIANWIDVLDQLTKEVLENSFLTPTNKMLYCKALEAMKPVIEVNAVAASTNDIEAQRIKERKFTAASTSALATAVLGASVAAFGSLIVTNKTSKKIDSITFEFLSSRNLIILIIPLTALCLVAFVAAYEYAKKRHRLKRYDNSSGIDTDKYN